MKIVIGSFLLAIGLMVVFCGCDPGNTENHDQQKWQLIFNAINAERNKPGALACFKIDFGYDIDGAGNIKTFKMTNDILPKTVNGHSVDYLILWFGRTICACDISVNGSPINPTIRNQMIIISVNDILGVISGDTFVISGTFADCNNAQVDYSTPQILIQ